jgi:hypothetical protein
MRQSLLYFIAAALFLIAAALSVFNDGVALKTGAGLVIGGVMLWLGIKLRRAGK